MRFARSRETGKSRRSRRSRATRATVRQPRRIARDRIHVGDVNDDGEVVVAVNVLHARGRHDASSRQRSLARHTSLHGCAEIAAPRHAAERQTPLISSLSRW